MCRFFSGIYTESGKLYTSKYSDSHTTIATEFGLRETSFSAEQRMVKVEFIPTDWTGEKLLDLSTWQLVIDEERTPAWCDEECKLEIRRAMERRVKEERFLSDGFDIEEIRGGTYLAISVKGKIKAVSGGDVQGYGTSTVKVGTVSGGLVYVFNISAVKVGTVSGGFVRGWGDSTVNIDTVSGGLVSGNVVIKNDTRSEAK